MTTLTKIQALLENKAETPSYRFRITRMLVEGYLTDLEISRILGD